MSKIVDYSEDQYHKIRHKEFIQSQNLINAWSEFVYLEYFKKIKNVTVLEFGGAMGHNLIYLSKYCNVFMVEPYDNGRKFAEQHGIRTAKDLSELKKMNDGKYDLILCRHVLEHLLNPSDILKELKSLLNPSGELILVLPVETKTEPTTNEIDFHLYCWTPRTAYNLLRTIGFNSIIWKYNYFTGKRIFLPLYKMFGVNLYRNFMKCLGRLLNANELIIRAKQ